MERRRRRKWSGQGDKERGKREERDGGRIVMVTKGVGGVERKCKGEGGEVRWRG